MAEAIDEEIEKGTHLRHPMPTFRIARSKRHGLDNMTFGQHLFEASLADGVGNKSASRTIPAPAIASRSAASLLSTRIRLIMSITLCG